MANALFASAKEAFLRGDVDMLSDTISVTLIDTGTYTFNAAHNFMDDVAAEARIASANLTSKSVSGGLFDAGDITFGAVAGETAEAIILWLNTGDDGTSALIAYFDTGITGMPVTPSGGDITLTWDESGIFSL